MGNPQNYPKFQAFDNKGKPLVGGKLFTYIGGTDTKQATFTDSNCSSQNTNPIILDARGEATVYLNGNYKLILSPSYDNDPPEAPIWTIDNIYGLPDQSSAGFSPNYLAFDQGAVGDGDTLKYFIDVMGDNPGTILLRHNSGLANTDYFLQTNLTIPATINVSIEKGSEA